MQLVLDVFVRVRRTFLHGGFECSLGDGEEDDIGVVLDLFRYK